LKLVGDRYALEGRQRVAVGRSARSDVALESRRSRQVPAGLLQGRDLAIDGFNAILTFEAALGGAVVLIGRDGTARDLGGIHGTYRRVHETHAALEEIGSHLTSLGAGRCTWLLDAPVSNSGRLRALMIGLAELRGWDWRVEVVPDPDPLLMARVDVVASADSAILDSCGSWFNLARSVVEAAVPGAFVVDLGVPPRREVEEAHAD
jgi:hypothetical protein